MVLKFAVLSFLILLISIVFFIFLNLPENKYLKHHKNLNKVINEKEEHFDFIIVGGGTAGSILANRLSKNSNVTVLLLEAGDTDHDLKLKIPAASFETFNTTNDWGYVSVPQYHKGNYSIFLPRGKVLGGSSSINAMIYIRGSAYDYDKWEQKYNLTGWNFENLLKYFKRSERQLRDKDKINTEYHGFEGEWSISDAKQHPISQLVVKAFQEEWGLPYITDFNGDKYQKEGVGFNQVNIANGSRCSISDAFLHKEILERDNLYIRTNTMVTKLLIRNSTAIGVEIENKSNGIKKFIYAKKEVILSGGAYNTPQILQLSGIGDRKLLEKFNITTIYENPEVGENLQDHPTIGLTYKTYDAITFDKNEKFPYNILAILEWFLKRSGVLETNIAEINGYFRSEIAKKRNESAPDFQIIGVPAIFVDQGKRKFDLPGGFSYGFILANPKSRGTVKIASNDPYKAPLIDPNVYGEEDDFMRVYETMNELKKVNKNKNLTDITSGGLLMDPDKASKEEMINYINEHTFLLYHGCCTAAMGKVVDERLRVYGIKNLRIVDASVMPEIIRGNTNAPTAAIAEKASDLIYEDYKLN